MDINSVFAELKTAAEKNDKLYRDMSELEKSIATKVVKNYYEIVQPVETRLAHLLKDIRETARFTVIPPAVDKEYLALDPEVDEEKFKLYLETDWRGVHLVYYVVGHRCGELWQAVHNATEYSGLNAFQLSKFASWLGTEEKATELVELLEKAYIPLLEWHKKNFEEIGNDLSETVDHLKSVLEGSHTVEQKEDGTVEIQLGGKTYIGRVKEA